MKIHTFSFYLTCLMFGLFNYVSGFAWNVLYTLISITTAIIVEYLVKTKTSWGYKKLF